MRVLITGFGPFPGAPFNPSTSLVKALTRRRRPAFDDVEIHAHVFATSYAAVDRDLPKLLAQQPDVVLLFGVAGRRRHLCVETRAQNAMTLMFPDADRRKPRDSIITPGAPVSLRGNAPFMRLLAAARGRLRQQQVRDVRARHEEQEEHGAEQHVQRRADAPGERGLQRNRRRVDHQVIALLV